MTSLLMLPSDSRNFEPISRKRVFFAHFQRMTAPAGATRRAERAWWFPWDRELEAGTSALARAVPARRECPFRQGWPATNEREAFSKQCMGVESHYQTKARKKTRKFFGCVKRSAPAPGEPTQSHIGVECHADPLHRKEIQIIHDLPDSSSHLAHGFGFQSDVGFHADQASRHVLGVRQRRGG